MARKQNELTAIQLNDAVFAGIVAQIKRFTPGNLATLANVSHTTICKYMRREPVGERYEKEIKKAIAKALENKQAKDNESVGEAIELINA